MSNRPPVLPLWAPHAERLFGELLDPERTIVACMIWDPDFAEQHPGVETGGFCQMRGHLCELATAINVMVEREPELKALLLKEWSAPDAHA